MLPASQYLYHVINCRVAAQSFTPAFRRFTGFTLNLRGRGCAVLVPEGAAWSMGTVSHQGLALQALRLGTGIASGLIVLLSGVVIPMLGLRVRQERPLCAVPVLSHAHNIANHGLPLLDEERSVWAYTA